MGGRKVGGEKVGRMDKGRVRITPHRPLARRAALVLEQTPAPVLAGLGRDLTVPARLRRRGLHFAPDQHQPEPSPCKRRNLEAAALEQVGPAARFDHDQLSARTAQRLLARPKGLVATGHSDIDHAIRRTERRYTSRAGQAMTTVRHPEH